MAVRRALAISTATQVVTTILSFIGVIAVSRLLKPAEIGVFSVAVSLIAFVHILRDFGVGNYIIQARALTTQHIRAAFTVMLLMSWTLAALLFVCKDWAAHFYGQAGVADVIGLICVNFLIVPFAAPVQSMLRRQMQFGRIAVVTVSSAVTQMCVAVAAAWNGLGYMSMAWASVAGMLTNVLVLTILRPQEAMPAITLHGLGDVFRFGYKSTANSFVSEAGAAAPDLIFGRTLGFDAVAFFSRASGLINMSVGQLNSLVSGVLFPAFARDMRDGHDPELLYRRAAGLLVGISAPVLAFMALMADPLIRFLFGDQWERSAFLASVLCSVALVNLPFAQIAPALVASGHVGNLLKLQLLLQGIRVAALMTSIWLPLERVVLVLACVSVITNRLNHYVMHKTIGLKPIDLWRSVRSSYVLAMIAILLPVVFRLLTAEEDWLLQPWQELALCGILFGVGWIGGIFLIQHPLKNEIMRAVALLK